MIRSSCIRCFRRLVPVSFILACLSWVFPSFAGLQEHDIESLKKAAPKVYIDCAMCDIDYIRTEITFVNYVRDRKEAQVHVLVTTLRTGSGGREYTLSFIGQHEFDGINDTQKYFSNQTDTKDEIRQGLVHILKIGLMSYVAKTPMAARIAISFAPEARPEAVANRWNFWVLSISTGGSFRGEKSYSSNSLRGSFAASRITPELKIRMSLTARYSRQNFEYDSQTIENISDSLNFGGLFVKSLGEHWSVGAFVEASSSTFENTRFSLSPHPAVEFNLFPYSQSTRRQLRFLYRFGPVVLRYREVSIYDKMSENLWREALSVTLGLKEKWGSVSTTLAGSHYFHDLKKNKLTLFSILNLRLVKGLNFYAFGGGSRIRDQLALPKGGASFEEILLRRKRLETNYSYFFSVGLSFTFGSIYTNVVNPRFGSDGRGGISIFID